MLFFCDSASRPELCLLSHWPMHVSLGPAPKPRSAILSQDKSGINTTAVGICTRKKYYPVVDKKYSIHLEKKNIQCPGERGQLVYVFNGLRFGNVYWSFLWTSVIK